MLKNNLKDISNIVLLRSDKILYELLNFDSNTKLDKSSSYEYGMKDYYPNSFRKGTIEYSMKHTLSHSDIDRFTLDYEFNFLDELFEQYLKIDGNNIYARPDTLDKYSSVINKIHPFNIIGCYLSKKLQENRLSLSNIKEYTKYITPLALDTKRDYKEYAENHLHLGGTQTSELNFFSMLSKPTEKEFYTHEIIDALPRINEFSYINNGNFSFGNMIDIAKYCVSIINTVAQEKSIENLNIKKDLDLLLPYGKLSMVDINFASFDMIEKLVQNNMNIKEPLLKELLKYKKENFVTKQWLLYNILIFNIHNTTSRQDIRRVIKIFIHITNIIRSYMVMSQNIGLSHFSEFSGSSVRKFEKNRFSNVAYNIISNGTNKVEAKITSNAIFNKDKEFISYKLSFDKEIIKKESSNIKKSEDKHFLNTNESKNNYHFCVHFIRKNEKEPKSINGLYPHRFHKLRANLKKEALKLNSFLYLDSHIYNKFDFYRKFFDNKIKVLKHKKVLENQYIDLSKLITTIDVAGDENRTPPEVFAPVIRYLRRDIKKLDRFKEDYIKYQKDGHDFVKNYRLRLSVHAGEDFNHIVTGMRKVHETVKFYGMDEKDRLGHALAIGLNPKQWCELNGDIFVTKLEHLDNLVWLYHQATEVMPFFKKASKIKVKYEKVIKELCEKVYGTYYKIDDLYKAWKLRQYCPIEGFNNSFVKSNEYLESVSSNKELDYNEAKKINEKYQRCGTVRKNGEKVIKIEYENNNTRHCKYYITDEELDLIEAVQDRLIEKFSQRGLIVETNPSSNVYIAHIHEYESHPIFRWNPIECKDLDYLGENIEKPKFNRFGIRNSRLKVCVNTDDPAIMPTTLRNEFDLLERTAYKVHSNSKEKIEKWSDDIRKFGVEIFDFDHQQCEFTRV